jgi:Tfp pilus assembly protein PilN
MRPVNLIPPEDRRGDRAPLRAGALSYIVVGAFAAVLVAVLALVLTQNSITDRENEIAELEVARDAATERVAALAPYAQFASLQQQREQTIASLADSRFDWERVLRELALVIPANVTLDGLDAATAGSADSGEASEAAVAVAASAGAVPSLSLSGCAPTHDDVASFVAALEDIDGVTRVGLDNSSKTEAADTAAPPAAPAAAGADTGSCGAGETSFSLLAVFDGVPAAPADPAAPVTPVAPATPTAATTPAGETAAETNSAQEQVQESQEATNVVPGAVR